jgi:ribosome-binding factor A
MKTYTRSERVAGEIQRIVSEILRKDISDPRLNRVAISGVKMSKDLRNARIYFTLSPGRFTSEDAANGFNRALGFIKRTLAGQLGLRYMPELRFFYDESFDYGSRIDQVLKSIDTADGSSHTPPE